MRGGVGGEKGRVWKIRDCGGGCLVIDVELELVGMQRVSKME